MHRHLFSKCFKNAVLGREEIVQCKCFFCFFRKFVNVETVLAVLREHIIFDVKWAEFRKMSEVFWAKLYCKISDILSTFYRLWDFLLENLKLRKKNSDDVHWKVWMNNIKLYARNNIIKKGIPHMRFYESLIFWSSFVFQGTGLGRFSQCFFFFYL